MIVRDEVETVKVALASLLLQTSPDWECVIIDDASTDGTSDVLRELSDLRFRVHHSDVPLGRGAARQKALSMARGRYIATLDGDDFYFPEKLERQSRILDKNPHLTATATGFFLCLPNGTPLGRAIGYQSPGFHKLPNEIHHLRVPFAPIMFRADHIGDSAYQESFLRSEDQDFFTKVLLGRHVHVSSDHLYAYRWHFLAENVLAGLKQGEKFYLSSFGKNPIRSAILFCYTRLKFIIYNVVDAVGLWDTLKRVRYSKASAAEEAHFSQVLRNCSSVEPTARKSTTN